MQDADVVLTTRKKMKKRTSQDVLQSAQQAGIPVMSLQDSTLAQCVNALRMVVHASAA
jgi:DNA gyrase/topoisomerase IV subunit A